MFKESLEKRVEILSKKKIFRNKRQRCHYVLNEWTPRENFFRRNMLFMFHVHVVRQQDFVIICDYLIF